MPPRKRNRMDRRSAAQSAPLLDLTTEPEKLVLTPPKAIPRHHVFRPSNKSVERDEADRDSRAAVRQQQAAIRNGIDWNICLIPGCGKEVPGYLRPKVLAEDAHNPDIWLPVCKVHGLTIWRTMNKLWKDPEVQAQMFAADDAYNQAVEKRVRVVEEREQAAAETIYILRQNGLIKVGWTGSIGSRLKAYGPNVEILCHFPGTRQDETNLHRQLRPSLAKGREWYHDDDLLALFIKDAVERHGPPTYQPWWSNPKKPIIKQRRRR